MSINSIKQQYYQNYGVDITEEADDQELFECVKVNQDDIDIDDYVPAEKEDNFVEFELFNVFMCYYKQLYQEDPNYTMLHNIDYDKENSTNKCMESMYEEMNKFNISIETDKDVVYNTDTESIDINECKELYVLNIGTEPKYVCKYLIPLLKYTSTMDWINSEWSVMKLK